jgi:DNA processing protein
MFDLPTLLEGATLPPALRDLPEPPERAFVHGVLPRGPAVAIVGTRTPTPRSRQYAAELACKLCREGVAVISGGAEGIDTAAHEGALAGDGPTVVVAPSSFDKPFPEKNAELYRTIVASGGAYISPFQHGVLARQHQFFGRNGWLVALSALVVVVELPVRSGASNAAKWARRLGRPVLVGLHPPWNERGAGCIEQLRLGARPLGSWRDVMRTLKELQRHPLGSSPAALDEADAALERRPARRSSSGANSDLSPLERRLFDAVLLGATSADEIVQVSGASAAEVNQGVLLLILKGLVLQDSAGTISPSGI